MDDIYILNTNDIVLGYKRRFCLETLRASVQSAVYQVTLEEGIYLKPLPLTTLKTLPGLQENLEATCKVGIQFPKLCGCWRKSCRNENNCHHRA